MFHYPIPGSVLHLLCTYLALFFSNLSFSDQSDRKRCGEVRLNCLVFILIIRISFRSVRIHSDILILQNFNECMRSSASRMDFTFSCDVSEGCSESDVTFWLRITKGPASGEIHPLFSNEIQNLFPDSLHE